MNDGVVSFLLFFIFLFIMIGGWLSQELIKIGWSSRKLLFILLIFLLSPRISFQYDGLHFTLLIIVIPITILFFSFFMSKLDIAHVLLGGILIGLLLNLVMELFTLDPVIVVMDERLLIAFILSVVINMLRVSLKIKLLITTLAIWIGFMYFIYKHEQQLQQLRLFSFYELDLLFTLYAAVLLMHVLYHTLIRALQKRWKQSLE